MSVLYLHDFSSQFDKVDQAIVVHGLHADIGFTDTVLQLHSSYLTDRTQHVSLSNHCSAFAPVHLCVPRSSVLGPIFITIYIKSLSAINDSHYHTPFISRWLTITYVCCDDKLLQIIPSLYAVTYN